VVDATCSTLYLLCSVQIVCLNQNVLRSLVKSINQVIVPNHIIHIQLISTKGDKITRDTNSTTGRSERALAP